MLDAQNGSPHSTFGPPLPCTLRVAHLPFVILSPVQILYGVLILSTMALIWAALAVIRHVRQQRAAARTRPESHDDNP